MMVFFFLSVYFGVQYEAIYSLHCLLVHRIVQQQMAMNEYRPGSQKQLFVDSIGIQ